MTKAIEAGLPKLKIEEVAAKKQARIDSGKDIIVGVNKFKLDYEDPLHILEVDNNIVRKQQIKRLEKLKSNRDNNQVISCLKKITYAAKNKSNNLLAFSR